MVKNMRKSTLSILAIMAILGCALLALPVVSAGAEGTVDFIADPVPDVGLVNIGDQVEVIAEITGAVDVRFMEMSVSWDSAVLEFVDAEAHSDFGSPSVFVYGDLDQTAGTLGTISNNAWDGGISGDVGWVIMTFRCVGYGTTDVCGVVLNALDSNADPIDVTFGSCASVTLNQPVDPMQFYFSDTDVSAPEINNIGDKFTTTIMMSDAADVQSAKAEIKFDPTKVGFISIVSDGAFGGSFPLPDVSRADEGYIIAQDARLSSPLGTDNPTAFFHIEFEVLDYGDSEIEFWEMDTRDPSGLVKSVPSEPGAPVLVSLPPPGGATPPTACFTPASGFFDINEVITLVDCSTAGQDVLPSPHANPVTIWLWYVDYGNDGVFEEGPVTSPPTIDTSVEDDILVKLQVIAPDSIPPTSVDYDPDDETTRLYKVRAPAEGPAMDVYTDKGGELDEPGCAYGPQELVTICAEVTYNGAPQQGKDVHFVVTSPLGVGDRWVDRVVRTDANGVACVSFRLPWVASGDPEGLFGEWTAKAFVDLAENIVIDEQTFTFGYLLEWNYDTTVVLDPVSRGGMITVEGTVSSIACEDLVAVTTATVYDDVSQTVDWARYDFTVAGGATEPFTMDLDIPTWAFVGAYGSDSTPEAPVVYLSLFDSSNGLPYCPEDAVGFDIQYP
jgi:hypothetical protein